ncbi:MAG: hypothetical protein ACRC4M_03990 [Mycoplasma sp.]
MEKEVKNYNQNNVKEAKPKKTPGIFIYQEAKDKLKINSKGKIYRQKVWSYLPVIGPLFSLIYANVVVGKTKCLRKEDAKKFSSTIRGVNLFGFILWPLLLLSIWTLLTVTMMHFANGDAKFGDSYYAMWANSVASLTQLFESGNIQQGIASIIGTLVQIFGSPLLDVRALPFGEAFSISSNIIFIVSLLILSMINPINIYNSIAFAGYKKRFTVVVEEDSVYQFRQQ